MDLRIFDIEQKNIALEILEKRSDSDVVEIERAVSDIIFDVRKNGDEAVFKYTKKFDGFDLDDKNIRVSDDEIKKAYDLVDDELVSVIKRCAKNIEDFHNKQLRETWLDKEGGIKLGQLFNPIEQCGVYVPGGKAVYPSSVLMNVVPAKVAGVKRIVMTTPPNCKGEISPLILVAADIAGVDEIYMVGGAQAIAALAYGTKSIKPVYKITGPGNVFVATAKKQVFGKVGIDMIAGPSEVMVVDDDSINKSYIAADILSQAEHDELASCIAVCLTKQRAEELKAEILRQAELLPKSDIAKASLKDYGMIFVADNINSAIDFANEVAPEHLELCVKDAEKYLDDIKNAGAVFLGEFSPEPLGDYFAGPNHVLPTNGTAKFSSPLNVDDFIKKSSIICYDRKSLEEASNDIQKFAEYEGLKAHSNSVKIRFEDI